MHVRFLSVLSVLVLMACPQSEEGATNIDSGVGAVDASNPVADATSPADTGSQSGADTGVLDRGLIGSDSGVAPAADAGVPSNPDTGRRDDAGQALCQTDDCPCEEDGDCRFDYYCNNSSRPGHESTCRPLSAGICRTDESCLGRCERDRGQRLGRCNDCRVDADCEPEGFLTYSCVDNACEIDECAGHADCEATQQCISINNQNDVVMSCVPRCNSRTWLMVCRTRPQGCICNMFNLVCDFESGLCQ